MGKIGVLLLNIGSPPSYEVPAVKKYLSTFLMDKDVINLPYPLRWTLVNLLIVPRRGRASAANYEKVWIKDQGSPLNVYSKEFAAKLQTHLGSNYVVKIGMRYADPIIPQALTELAEAQVSSLILAPMFPQYAEATTGSALKEVHRLIGRMGIDIPTTSLAPFFASAAFVQPSARLIREKVGDEPIDHYLFSFHGLPESHIRKIPGCLQTDGCCFEKNACAKNCYRAQCFESATQIAESLQLQESHWSVSFQSRLGRAEWLKPSTEHSLEILARTGKKNIAIICPSFVADCIETLEEIAIGAKEEFLKNGGKNLEVVPCVNADADWVAGFADLITNHQT
ncbi:MAG: ferrochelatase [Bdellovibrio sp.]|nr:ferrochelatase [Bdellovibrio sp.]